MKLFKYTTLNSDRKAAIMAGCLYILFLVTGILSVAYAVDAPDYLFKAAENESGVLIAAFFQLLMIPPVVGIAITLYPVLKKSHPRLAVGFVSFRVIAAGFIFLAAIFLLLILTLSQEFMRVGAPEASHFQTLGLLLQKGRDLVNHIAMTLALCLSSLFYCVILYKAKLVPRWLSGWGLVGIAVTIITTFLIMFQSIGILSTGFMVLSLPLGLQEIVLAVWLIFKGFQQTE
ncbi:MAG: DUF4386 domain-containing protein [Anaerolinea sp.]|nr:DUF4386 domain-containing protein [Anaerolinea sp.]